MIIGIDLGTTYSAVATIGADGRPVIIPNTLGEPTTPSVVHFESPAEALVGVAAQSASAIDPDNGIALVKRQMGTDCQLLFHGVRHSPQSISALILAALVRNAADHHGSAAATEPVRAVITVPAYFGIPERGATRQAARLAGLDVLELLSEPVAAALHYGTSALSAFGGGSSVLVYDLGGGTFDTTVLRVTTEGVRVVATDGDSQLGGADWDSRIAEYLAAAVATALPEVDTDNDDEFWPDVARAAETAKRVLSVAERGPVTLRPAGVAVTVEFTRDILRELGADLVARTLGIVDRVLAAAWDRGVKRIDNAILVGGSTKMPAVADALAEHLGLVPRLFEPDLAVVYGAAIRAHQLAGERAQARLGSAGGLSAAIADRPTTSVVPRSVGVLLHDSHDPSGTRQLVVHAVHRNSPLPAAATMSFGTIVHGQDRVRIQVFEQAGELPSESVSDNRRVLDGELTGLPTLPAGSLIEVRFEVDAGGLLRVSAREPRSGAELTLEGYLDGVLDGAEAEAASRALTAIAVRQ